MAECYTYEDGSWYCWYDNGDEQWGDAEGDTYYKSVDEPGFNFFGLAETGIDAALDILSRRGYIPPPTSPRVITNTYQGAIPGISASAGVNRGGLSTGFTISKEMLIYGGLAVALFFFGMQRGGRR